eukprot:15465173-Alexandrium_andersonii.AAC.1
MRAERVPVLEGRERPKARAAGRASSKLARMPAERHAPGIGARASKRQTPPLAKGGGPGSPRGKPHSGSAWKDATQRRAEGREARKWPPQ